MRYVVYVYQPREMREVFLRDPRGQNRDVLAFARAHQPETNFEDGDSHKYTAFVCEDEITAIATAEQFVRMDPSADVLIGEVKMMVSAQAPVLVRKQVTNKGVLPV